MLSDLYARCIVWTIINDAVQRSQSMEGKNFKSNSIPLAVKKSESNVDIVFRCSSKSFRRGNSWDEALREAPAALLAATVTLRGQHGVQESLTNDAELLSPKARSWPLSWERTTSGMVAETLLWQAVVLRSRNHGQATAIRGEVKDNEATIAMKDALQRTLWEQREILCAAACIVRQDSEQNACPLPKPEMWTVVALNTRKKKRGR